MDDSWIQFLPFETTDINEPSILELQKEINESPETRARCLVTLRRNLKNLENLDPCLDDCFLLAFLRTSKFNVQKALQRKQRFYQQYDVLLGAFKKFSIPLHKAQSLNHLSISPYRLKNNSILIIGYNEKVDYKKYSFGERFYTEILLFHKLVENPVNHLSGVTLLLDYGDFNIHGIIACSPGWVRMFLNTLLDAFPCRVKAVHLVNISPLFTSVLKLGLQFMSKKIKDRIFIHSRNNDWRNLHASIPIEVLPEQFGGKLKDEDLINCLEDIEELEKNFLKSFAFGSLENQYRRKSMKVLC